MEESVFKFDLKEIKKDLIKGINECSQRGLLHTTKWLAELNFSLSHIKLSLSEMPQMDEDTTEEVEVYIMAKTYFDSKEYDRCAFFTQNCATPKCRFLHLYASYLAGEKKKLDNATELNNPPCSTQNTALKNLLNTLQQDYSNKKLDGYGLYLYGVILKKLDLVPLAIDILLEAIRATPLHWGAWLELSPLIPNKEKLHTISLPDHWIKGFFIASCYLEQLFNDEALEIYSNLQNNGFEKSNYITARMAIAHHNRRELEKAVELFRYLQTVDPYRLDNLDTYSNLLYVKEMKTELANLAHHVVSVDKYRVETCCVVGNYYSLRSDHQKAVIYFSRALKLNPLYLSAWTLMGHEYMEMKNTNAAIQSYRQAIEVNKRDYRAWYGLGQTYEILKMPFYSLYYYKKAQELRPADSRMLIALGETYEKIEKIENALKCYHKACNVGDVEGSALLNLAKLYDTYNDEDNAAAAYTEYCLSEPKPSTFPSEQVNLYAAYRYLANYHMKKGNLDDAHTYAYKCLEFEDTKDEGKSLLRTIATKRGHQDPAETTTDAMDVTNLGLQADSLDLMSPSSDT